MAGYPKLIHTALDAVDARALAEFYRELLGAVYRPGDEVPAAGPDLAEHGVVRWRRADLARVIEQRFGVRLDERTVGRLLRRLGFQRLSVRPRHPRADPKAQAAHKTISPRWLPPPSPSARAASRSSSGGKMRLESARRAH